MHNYFPSYTIAYIISAVLCFLSAGMIWKRRNNPGSTPFALLMLALAVWSFASIFETGVMTVNEKLFWSKWQYLGIVNVAPLWILFTMGYTGRSKSLTNTMRWLLWIIPFGVLLLVFTNEFHHLVWNDVTIIPGTVNTANYARGIVFYIHTAFSYTCLLLGMIWLIKDFMTAEKSRQFQSVFFIFGVIIAWAANALYILRLVPWINFDITPLSISFIALILAWPISRNQIFDLVPIAKDALLNSLHEGVIVKDPNDVILEINPAALEILKYEGTQPIGRPIGTVFEKYESVIEQFRNMDEVNTEIELSGDLPRTIDLQVSTIEEKKEKIIGQLIVIRDISDRKKKEKIGRNQQKFAEALADTAAAVNSSLDLDSVLEKILENVAKVVPHDAANIALVTEEGRAKFVRVKNPKKYGSMDNLILLDLNVLEMPNFKNMARTKKGVITRDTHDDKNWLNNIKDSDWIRSFLGVPIIFQEKVLGFISLDSGTPNYFTPQHLERLEVFANYTATALTNAKLYSETKLHAEEMSILYEISLAIAAGVGLEKTTQAIFRQLKKVIPIDLFYLALYEPVEKILSYFMYRENGVRIDIPPLYLYQKPSLTRFVIEKQETVYIPDFKSEDSILKEGEIIRVAGFDNRTILGIPLILRGEVIGMLSMQAEKPNAYDHDQIRLLETIAQQISIAMDNAKLFEKMQTMAVTDSLTGLYNRRYFYMTLENEIERSKRYQFPLSMIMLDIDYFKRVNDRLGHLAGDEVLAAFANVCKNQLRQSDVMFRYGGEEFMILLPESNSDDALNAAERIRAAIEKSLFETKSGSVQVTASIGVAELESENPDSNAFVEAADKAMYASKSAGRNCVKLSSRS